MECIIGVAVKDFVILAADTSAMRNITVLSSDDENSKLFQLSDQLLIAAAGDPGDKAYFINYVRRTLSLYKLRHHYQLGVSQAAHYTRRTLAEALRGKTPYQLNMLLGGYDGEGAGLYFIDFLGSMVKINSHACCYGASLVIGVLDRYYRNNLTLEEAYQLVEKCVAEIRKRYLINYLNFRVQVVNKNGICDLPNIIFKSPLIETKETIF